MAKLEPWSIGWGYTKASSLYDHKIKANRPGVKFVARSLRDLNRYSTGCNAHSHRHKARMSVSPAQHGSPRPEIMKKEKSSKHQAGGWAHELQAASLTAKLGHYRMSL